MLVQCTIPVIVNRDLRRRALPMIVEGREEAGKASVELSAASPRASAAPIELGDMGNSPSNSPSSRYPGISSRNTQPPPGQHAQHRKVAPTPPTKRASVPFVSPPEKFVTQWPLPLVTKMIESCVLGMSYVHTMKTITARHSNPGFRLVPL